MQSTTTKAYRTKPPVAVREAISNFRAVGAFTLEPRKDNETSYIHDWGVRVSHADGTTAWVCLASEACRQSKDSLFVLPGGKTSKAAQHLGEKHQIFSSKTLLETQKKRKRDEEDAVLKECDMFTQEPERFALLVETQRIVNHNLPFVLVEYDESKRINRLTKKEDMNSDFNAKQVYHAIVELYATTKAEVIDQLRSGRMTRFGNLTMMVDMWTCTVTHKKYVGLRVFLVDSEFELKTFLLGVRIFKPTFADRDENYRACFEAWIHTILQDFKLGFDDFYAGSSDCGKDVRALLSKDLNYQWEWCVAHMAHAATKVACGMDVTVRESKNPMMTELISRVTTTISNVRSVETAGDLFEALCIASSDGNTTQLLDYSARRFLSITSSFERILEKWDILEEWYDARIEQARRKNYTPPVFPLKNDKTDLVQILSLLKPINQLKVMCQSPRPNQVSVLLTLYHIRLHTLRTDAVLAHYRSDRTPTWIQPADLTPLAKETRKLLQQAFDERFFCRYTDARAIVDCSYVFELQQKLHPNYKHPDRSLIPIVRLCCKSAGMDLRQSHQQATRLNEMINTKLRDLMIRNAGPPVPSATPAEALPPVDPLEIEFGSCDPVLPQRTRNSTEVQVDEELARWRADTRKLLVIEEVNVPAPQSEVEDGSATQQCVAQQREVNGSVTQQSIAQQHEVNVSATLQPEANGRDVKRDPPQKETVLQFWKRMADAGEYKILPVVVRILYAIPTSSTFIERDFSVCKSIITPQRASMAPTTFDMCSFLNRNKAYTDLTQCMKIAAADIQEHLPPAVTYPLPPRPAMFDEDLAALDGMIDILSSASFSIE